MKIQTPTKEEYIDCFYRNNEREKKLHDFYIAIFGLFLWGKYIFLPLFQTFDGQLYTDRKDGMYTFHDPTALGYLLVSWIIIFVYLMFKALMTVSSTWFILKKMKKQEKRMWDDVFAGFKQHTKKLYKKWHWGIAILIATIGSSFLLLLIEEPLRAKRLLYLFVLPIVFLIMYRSCQYIGEQWKEKRKRSKKKTLY